MPRKEEKRPPMAIADRWLPKPVVLENAAGAHRFVWDLRWSSSGGSEEIEEDEGFGAPHGPRVVPGTYQVKLTVDGNSYTQPLKIEMDPRARVTPAELDEQLRVGLEIFGEVRLSRKTLAEMESVKKRLDELKLQPAAKSPTLQSQIADLGARITKIQKGDKPLPGEISGLESANAGLSAALRVVETSDRTLPSQAIELYRQSGQVAKTGIAEWSEVKSNDLVKLNQALQKAGSATIQISELELEIDDLMSQ
jgi:hypothetical protein